MTRTADRYKENILTSLKSEYGTKNELKRFSFKYTKTLPTLVLLLLL